MTQRINRDFRRSTVVRPAKTAPIQGSVLQDTFLQDTFLQGTVLQGKARQGMTRAGQVVSLLLALMVGAGTTQAAERYTIDTEGAHAFIEFKISHLGFSWLMGRFNTFEGGFVLDEDKPEQSSVTVGIDVSSIDTNHAERDKHLKGEDFFDVEQFPKASFKSTQIAMTGEKTAKIKGDLTLKGITKPVVLDAKYVGGGQDPWGGYRQGFEATTKITLTDFGIDYKLGPTAEQADVFLYVEGIRQ